MVQESIVKLATLLSLGLVVGGCSFELVQSTTLVGPGGVATFTFEIFNDESQFIDITAYSIAHVPSAWSLVNATFQSTGIPESGTGTVISDPGFVCSFDAVHPPPGAGRKAVFILWGTSDIANPQTSVLELSFAVGPAEGTYDVDLFQVMEGSGDTLCSVGYGATTHVATGAIFGDRFEDGNLIVWSSSMSASLVGDVRAHPVTTPGSDGSPH
ncbi:MAG: hypothetical protein MPN21_01720 [Thermoanaerobaculia bacterium]|nr:hypothetical protein [Thermoanaerobaculia bacterium]